MGRTQRQVGSAVFWSVFARGGRFFLGLASSIIVVRGLGVYDYGVLSVVRTVLMFAAIIAGVGMGQAVLKFLPVLRVKRGTAGSQRLIAMVVSFQTIAWAALLGVCFLLRHRFEMLFPVEGIGTIIVIAVGLALFQLYFTILSHILNSYYDTKLLSLANILSHALYIGLLFVLMPRWGVIGVVAAGAVGNLAAALLVLKQARRHLREGREDGTADRIDTARLLRYSMPFALIGILNVIVWRQSETLFLAHFHGAKLTGYFDLAYRLPQTMLEFIPGTVWPIIMAGFSEVYTRNTDNLVAAIEKYYRVLFMLCAPICLYGVVLGGSMVRILFGDDMSSAAIPAQIFFLVFAVSFFATPLSMSLYVIEKSYANMLVYIGFAAVNIGLDLLLIPRYGLAGAIIPVGLVILLSPFVYFAVLSRYVSGIRVPFRFIFGCFAASSPVALLIPLIQYTRTPAGFILASLAALLLFLAGFKFCRIIGEEERDLVNSIPLPVLGKIVKYISA